MPRCLVVECAHLSQSFAGALLDLREVTDILMADPGEGVEDEKEDRHDDIIMLTLRKMKRKEERN